MSGKRAATHDMYFELQTFATRPVLSKSPAEAIALSDEPKTKLPVGGRRSRERGPISRPKPGIVMAEDTMALLDETDFVVMKPGQVLFWKGELDATCTSSSRARCRSFVSNHMR